MSWPVSSKFLDALRSGSINPILQIDVLSAGVVQASSGVVSAYDLTVLDGQVSDVYRSNIRRQFQVSVVDATGALVPTVSGALLDPISNNEVRVYRGLAYDDGTSELIPQITAPLEVNEIDDQRTGVTMNLSGYDRAKAIADNPWRTPFHIAASTNIGTAIQNIINDRLGSKFGVISFSGFSSTSEVTSSAVDFGGDSSDPWADAQSLAAGIGYELWFNQMGQPIFQPIPDPATKTVARSYLEDGNGILLDPLNRSVDKSTLRNGVIVTSEASWLIFPIVGSAWDDDPSSPVRRGLIGEWPEKTSSPTIFTQAQADASAAAMLKQIRGVEEQVTWNAIPDPSLEGGDVIEIQADSFGGTVRLLVETLTTPQAVDGVQNGTTRRRRTA